MISNLSQVLDEEREARRAAEEENELLQAKAEGKEMWRWETGRVLNRRTKMKKRNEYKFGEVYRAYTKERKERKFIHRALS